MKNNKIEEKDSDLQKENRKLRGELRKIQTAARSMVIQNLHLEGTKDFTLQPFF
jgi:hypothetical protein